MLFPLFLTIKHRRDLVYRKKTKQFEIAANVERALISNKPLKLKKKQRTATNQLRSARVKNICIWSGRCRGIVYNGFSRHAMKFFGTRGRWLGLRKASW
jgi:ribosomal protein S14